MCACALPPPRVGFEFSRTLLLCSQCWSCCRGGSPSEWGGIAMLAHCAQTVEEETVPAVAPPAARARASDEGIKKGSVAGEPDDANYSRKEKSLGLLCDKFLQEYSSAAEVSEAFELSPGLSTCVRACSPTCHVCLLLLILIGPWDAVVCLVHYEILAL